MFPLSFGSVWHLPLWVLKKRLLNSPLYLWRGAGSLPFHRGAAQTNASIVLNPRFLEARMQVGLVPPLVEFSCRCSSCGEYYAAGRFQDPENESICSL